jgi:hypothetical protein
MNRGQGEARGAPIDATRWFERIVAEGILPVSALERVTAEGVPDSFAVLATGTTEEGGALLVGFSPKSGGDAALATLAHAQRLLAEQGFTGESVALSPDWSIASRRRLELLRAPALRFRAMAASGLAEDGGEVASEPAEPPVVVAPRQLAAQLSRGEDREIFLRGLEAFAGLAAKHGGAVRGTRAGAELVLLARRVAVLHARDGGVLLETVEPERSSVPLSSESIATAMDRLEGLLRKRLNDRRVREGEEGMRAQVAPQLASMLRLRASLLWPLSGSDPEVLDLAAVAEDGRCVVAAVRERLTLPILAEILDATLALRPALPALLAAAPPPVLVGTPRLLLAARDFDALALRALQLLGLETVAHDVRPSRGGFEIVARELLPSSAAAGALPRAPSTEPAAREPIARPPREDRAAREPIASAPPPRREDSGRREEPFRREEPPRRGDSGRRDERPRREEPARFEDAPGRPDPAAAGGAQRFEAISLFDLEDEARPASAEPEGEDSQRRGRRRRGRRRRGRGSAGGPPGEEAGRREDRPWAPAAPSPRAAEGEEGDGGDAPGPWEAAADRSEPEPSAPADEVALVESDDVEDLGTGLHPLADDLPEIEEEPVPSYDDEEEFAGEPLGDDERERRERELRRRARIAKAAPEVEPAPAPAPQLPRRRAAFIAHADRDSLAAAIVLARDLRLVEGFWVFPQADLMTFFRGVATDLRGETPIYLVGFTATPARDTIGAAALYAGRIAWFDHHDWPPEDLESLRLAIGKENVHVQQGAGSSLPLVLDVRSRRSRFSDKLVELVTARFSLHDHERWGRVWWQRLGELAAKPGDKRAAVEPLLVGRPSDLAHDAARAPATPLPPEVEYVSGRDFRVVHFGGYTLAVVPVPRDLDLHLTARIARERYGAQLSVAHAEGSELVVLTGEDGVGRRSLDLGRLVSHLATVHEWIEALSDEDHVARMRVRQLPSRPERLDDVIAEIAMGRSLFEA